MMTKELMLHNRYQQVAELIEQTNASLSGLPRERKYQALLESPYRFFRGTSALFWQDVYNDWRYGFFGGSRQTQTWIQGDAHVYNFGAFTNHHREVVYGLDDFDDALVSDYQYDLWRLAVSIVLCGREQGDLSDQDLRKVLRKLCRSYIHTLKKIVRGEHHSKGVHFTARTSGKPLAGFLEKVERKKNRQKMLDKWTRTQKNERRVLHREGKIKRVSPQQRKKVLAAFEAYRSRFEDRVFPADEPKPCLKVKDVARRLKAGTGSLGKDRFYLLVEGASGAPEDDMILDIKLQDGPAALIAMTPAQRAIYDRVFDHEGLRHMRAYEALAEHPDPYLGFLEMEGAFYSIRERSPFKKDFPTENLTKAKHFKAMAKVWGRVIATEHARGSRSLNEADKMIFPRAVTDRVCGRKKEFVRLVEEIAIQYATRVEADYSRWLHENSRPEE